MSPFRQPNRFPKPADRLPLGLTGLKVSPLCLGITGVPEIIPEAYDRGVNFFFISGDLHWPLYDGVRKGLEMLFDRGSSIRDEVVVGVVSYLDGPIFEGLQFNEVIDNVRGLGRVDLLIAGAVWNEQDLGARFAPIYRARASGYLGSRAIGASFHHRRSALLSLNYNYLDINYVRYNTAHPGARQDTFPFVRADRTGLVFNFKSVLSRVTPERFKQLGIPESYWLPKASDYYRFVLTHPDIDGILCSPATVEQLDELIAGLEEGPMTPQQEEYMVWLSSTATPRYFEA